MSPDADRLVAATVGSGDHVDLSLLGRPQFPKVGRRAMAEDGAFARSQNRREVPALPADLPVADCIDAAVQGMQPLRADAISDLVARQPDAFQLLATDHTVLPGRKSRDRGVESARFTFGRYMRLKVKLATHPGRVARRAHPAGVARRAHPAGITRRAHPAGVARRTHPAGVAGR